MQNPIQKYLAFKVKLAKINEKYELNKHEIELINFVAKAQFSKQLIAYRWLLDQKIIGSKSKISGALKSLIEKEMLIAEASSGGDKLRMVSLTKLAHTYFKRLNKALASV